MIVVDSSVWINHLREVPSPPVLAFRKLQPNLIIVGDLIALEVLRGLRNEQEALALEAKFLAYGVTALLDPGLAFAAAGNYRSLRSSGVTVKRLADLIIATFCIESRHHLLHEDRDFDHFERHLGLKVFRPV